MIVYLYFCTCNVMFYWTVINYVNPRVSTTPRYMRLVAMTMTPATCIGIVLFGAWAGYVFAVNYLYEIYMTTSPSARRLNEEKKLVESGLFVEK